MSNQGPNRVRETSFRGDYGTETPTRASFIAKENNLCSVTDEKQALQNLSLDEKGENVVAIAAAN